MSDREAIERIRGDYESACKAGNLKAWLATLTDDAVLLVPGSPVMSGSEIESWAANYFSTFDGVVKMENDEVEIINDWAFIRGKYTMSLKPKAGGDTLEEKGKYLDLMRRQGDGEWKFSRLIWNSDSIAS